MVISSNRSNSSNRAIEAIIVTTSNNYNADVGADQILADAITT
jgi:hypothetical protein